MKTLYQRLSEENRVKIEEASKELPTTMYLLKNFLNTDYAWSKIELHNAMSLHSVLEPMKQFDLETFINFFEND